MPPKKSVSIRGISGNSTAVKPKSGSTVGFGACRSEKTIGLPTNFLGVIWFFSVLRGGKHGTQTRIALNQNLNNPKQPALNQQLAIPMIKWLVSELASFKILFACCIFVPTRTRKQRPLKPVKKVPKTKKDKTYQKHQAKQAAKLCLDLFRMIFVTSYHGFQRNMFRTDLFQSRNQSKTDSCNNLLGFVFCRWPFYGLYLGII